MPGVIVFADPPKKRSQQTRPPSQPTSHDTLIEQHGRLGDLTRLHEPLFPSPLRQVWNASNFPDARQHFGPRLTLEIPDDRWTAEYGVGYYLDGSRESEIREDVSEDVSRENVNLEDVNLEDVNLEDVNLSSVLIACECGECETIEMWNGMYGVGYLMDGRREEDWNFLPFDVVREAMMPMWFEENYGPGRVLSE